MKITLKTGFTLVEVMVFFLFITLLLSAAAPVITKRLNIPSLKRVHGTFICYRANNGTLKEKMINGADEGAWQTRAASSACEFHPPKRVALYKIDMIGAGGGGDNTLVITNTLENDFVSTETRYCTFSDRYCLNDDGTPNPSYPEAGMLNLDNVKAALGGSSVAVSKYTGAGGSGGWLSYVYYPPATAYNAQVTYSPVSGRKQCGDALGAAFVEGTVPDLSCNAVKEREAAYKAELAQHELFISSKDAPRTRVENIHKPIIRDLLYKHGLYLPVSTGSGEPSEQQIKESITDLIFIQKDDKITKLGGSGGKGALVSYQLQLRTDNINSVSGLMEYLNKVREIRAGQCSNENCSDFEVVDKLKNGKHGDTTNTAKHEDIPVDAEYPEKGTKDYDDHCGKNVEKFAAIRLPDGTFLMNEKRATGGEGAKILINGQTGLITFPKSAAGQDASGLRIRYGEKQTYSEWLNGTKGTVKTKEVVTYTPPISLDGPDGSFNITEDFPYISVANNLNVVKHTIGLNGENGEHPRPMYTAHIGGDCRVVPGRGGAVGGEAGNTTITCPNFTHSVRGGKAGGTDIDIYRPADHIAENPSSYRIEQKTSQAINFTQTSRVFSKFNFNALDIGRGGNGVGVSNRCIQPWGNFGLRVYDRFGDRDVPGFESVQGDRPACVDGFGRVDESYYTKTSATAGTGGAVIITW